MKKFVALLLVVVMCFAFTACGSSSGKNSQKFNLKETVSTDIVDFTLENSEFAYYVSNSSSTYVEPTDKPNSMFASKTGTCYVSMTVTITNKDRGGHIDFGGYFDSWKPLWNVKYNGETYEMFGFDLNQDNSKTISLQYGAYVDKDTGKTISKIGSSNILIDAGETVTIRFFSIIHIEPESLKDGFDLEVKVPNSAGERETFTYTIPAKA